MSALKNTLGQLFEGPAISCGLGSTREGSGFALLTSKDESFDSQQHLDLSYIQLVWEAY